MWTNKCTWCKIGLVALLAAVAALIGGLTISTGGAGAAISGAIGKVVGAAMCAFIAKILVILVGAGLGLLFGDYVCCKVFKVAACCVKDSVEFWMDFSKRLEASADGNLSEDDCRALNSLIDRLLRERKIDAATAQKLRDALKEHCPGG